VFKMSWDVKRDGKRWGVRKLKKTKWLEGGIKVYEVELLEKDGSPEKIGGSPVLEVIELQPFLEFCLCCGQNIVDTRKGGGCSIQKACCSICWKECQRIGTCQLK